MIIVLVLFIFFLYLIKIIVKLFILKEGLCKIAFILKLGVLLVRAAWNLRE